MKNSFLSDLVICILVADCKENNGNSMYAMFHGDLTHTGEYPAPGLKNLGKPNWKYKTKDQPVFHLLEGIQASPAVADSIMYFGARDGYFYALNANTGDSLRTFSADNSWVLTTAAIRILHFMNPAWM